MFSIFMSRRDRRSREDSAREAGVRSERLEELFREELNSLLSSDVSDSRLEGVRFTHVSLTRDGSTARVWFVVDDSEVHGEHVHATLSRAAGFLRSRLCDALPLKRIPELRFARDPAASAAAFEDPDG